MPKSLSIYGAGRLGQTLAHLWQKAGVFQVQQLFNRSEAQRQAAVDFIGLEPSQACSRSEELTPADVWLLACPDSALASTIDTLCSQADTLQLSQAPIIFHCSGALSSALLQPLADAGAHVASIHPLHSFAEPALSVKQFHGSHCAYEGMSLALDTLLPAFAALGAQCFAVSTEHKLQYHAGSVIACNYLAPLMEASFASFASAGIGREQAAHLLQPLMTGTLSNIASKGPAEALTGPIARGDVSLVAAQWQALQESNVGVAKLYQQLGLATTELAQQRDNSIALTAQLKQLEALLSEKN